MAMSVSIVYEYIDDTRCMYCDYMWDACIETVMIDWGRKKEIKEIPKIECPNCKHMTKINREDIF